MGFFQKMEQSDIFVILTHCDFTKNNYQNRFFYQGWNTMSTNKGHEPIRDKRYVNHVADWNKIITKHPKAALFTDCLSNSLSIMNISIIDKIRNILDIKIPIVMDYHTELKGSERLLDICKHYGATEYLSGIGGKKYLDVKLFEDNGINVIFQDENKIDKRAIIEII